MSPSLRKSKIAIHQSPIGRAFGDRIADSGAFQASPAVLRVRKDESTIERDRDERDSGGRSSGGRR